MSRKLTVPQVVGDSVVFAFTWPLSIDAFLVVSATGQAQWLLLADEHDDFELSVGTESWPISQAPPEAFAALSQLEDRFGRHLHGRAPRNPAISKLTYGQPPAGYHSKVAPQRLLPGEYTVLVLAEQGGGVNRFLVPPT